MWRSGLRDGLGSSILALAIVWVPVLAQSRPNHGRAAVPPDLASDPAYTKYAGMLVQLDLLANPSTASLPIAVTSHEPGILSLTGVAPNPKIRDYLVQNARRISGLEVRDEMRAGRLGKEPHVPLSKDKLAATTIDALQALFPEIAQNLKVTVNTDGIVVLNGTVTSYAEKLLLSQAVKSQPGCKAVHNLLMVGVDRATGHVKVTEDGFFTVAAARLPAVPPGPIVDLSLAEEKPKEASTIAAVATRGFADDSVTMDLFDRQIKEDARHQIEQDMVLGELDIQIDASEGTLVLSGDLKTRENVEKAIAIVSAIPGLQKVVAKTKPFSMQRHIVSKKRAGADAEDAKPTKDSKRLGFLSIPWKSRDNDENPALDRRFREGVRRSLKKRCEGRLDNIVVREGLDRLVIEGEVANPRDRAFVLKIVDNMVELRTLNYDLVLRLQEF